MAVRRAALTDRPTRKNAGGARCGASCSFMASWTLRHRPEPLALRSRGGAARGRVARASTVTEAEPGSRGRVVPSGDSIAPAGLLSSIAPDLEEQSSMENLLLLLPKRPQGILARYGA